RTRSLISPTAPSITATDAAAHFNSTAPVTVLSLAPTSLGLFGVPSGVNAGGLVNVTVAALDVYGNAAAGYTGTVHFTSSDPQAVLPADYTFTAADGGAHTFALELATAGAQSLAVADVGNSAFSASQSGITVVPATPSAWVVNGVPTATTAGSAMTFTLT